LIEHLPTTSTDEWLRELKPVFWKVGSGEACPGKQLIVAGRRSCLTLITSASLDLRREPAPIAGRLLDAFGFQFVLRGSAEFSCGNQAGRAEPGDILILDLQRSALLKCRSMPNGPFEQATLWLPRPLVLAHVADEYLLHGRVLASDAPETAVFSAALRSLSERAQQTTAHTLNAIAPAMASLAAAAYSAAASNAARSPAPQEAFVIIRRYIDQNLSARDLGITSLTRTFGLSRASLYRLFQSVGGIASFIRMRRLERARLELNVAGSNARRIGPIAYQAGFKSLAAFNRAYRQTYGQTPRQTRNGVNCTVPRNSSGEEPLGLLARSLLAMSA